MEEHSDDNHPWILQEGVCAVYKKGGVSARENLEKWIESSHKELRYHNEYDQFCKRMRKAVKLLPKDSNIYIGEIAPEEGIGLEALFSETGRSIFTIIATTPEVKYYPVTKSIRKVIWQHYPIKSKLMDYVMSVLMYRLKCLENILLLLVRDNEKHHEERAGEFNNMIGSKALKSCYVQETDVVMQSLKSTTGENVDRIKTRSKLSHLKKAVALEENKMRSYFSTEIIDPLSLTSFIVKKDPPRSRLGFQGNRFSKFNKAVTNDPHKEVSRASFIKEPEFPMESLMESSVLIQNFHRLKELSVKVMKRKEQMEKAKEHEIKNKEIQQVIDGYSARTRGRSVL